jgi:hypothetical protein
MAVAELPAILKIEHDAIHEELARATRAGGKTAEAAAEVIKVLFPHVVLEEDFALPPLTLLPRLARGEITPDMGRAMRQAELLEAELPRMLDEHRLIAAALQKLLAAASAEQQTGYARFAQRLIAHAQTEEEVLYPASILIGKYLRLKLGRPSRQ